MNKKVTKKMVLTLYLEAFEDPLVSVNERVVKGISERASKSAL